MASKKPTKTDEAPLPPIEDGEMAVVDHVELLSKKTRPPTYFTEGTLGDAMESAARFVEDKEWAKVLRRISGIGRPATRPAIIEGLKRSELITEAKAGKKTIIKDTPRGRAVHDFIEPELRDVGMTAQWETGLEAIAEGTLTRDRFERSVTGLIDRMLEIYRAKERPKTPIPPPSWVKNKKGGNKPTAAQIKFAETLAKRLNIKLPRKVRTDFDACRAFLDEHAGQARSNGQSGGGSSAPSEKAIDYAKSIAERRGVEIPDETLADRRALSKWIDEHK